MTDLEPTTDGVVTIRPPRPADREALLAVRDAEFHRFLGPGSPDPRPFACIEVGGRVVGWVDHDRDPDHDWLGPDEVNVGYALAPDARGRGHASRAVALLLHHLAVATDVRVASLLIDPANGPSLALGARLGFAPGADVRGQRYLARPVPPVGRDAVGVTRRGGG